MKMECSITDTKDVPEPVEQDQDAAYDEQRQRRIDDIQRQLYKDIDQIFGVKR